MKPKRKPPGFLTSDAIDTEPVAGGLVMARALEIATSDGRQAIDLSSQDWQQAKRELTGESP